MAGRQRSGMPPGHFLLPELFKFLRPDIIPREEDPENPTLFPHLKPFNPTIKPGLDPFDIDSWDILDDRWWDGPRRPSLGQRILYPDAMPGAAPVPPNLQIDPNAGPPLMPLGTGQAPPPGIPPWSDSATGEPEQQGSIDPRTPRSAARDWEAPQPAARAPRPVKKRTSGGVKGPSKRGAARGGQARSVRRSGPRVGGA